MALAGLTFFLHELGSARNQVKNLIAKHHGAVGFSISPKTTHLVTTDFLLDSDSDNKILQARQKSIEICTPSHIDTLISSRASLSTRSASPAPNHYASPAPEKQSLTVFKAPISFSREPNVLSVVPAYFELSEDSSQTLVTLIGTNFKPSPLFQVQFGDAPCSQIEYHCETVIVVTVQTRDLTPGVVTVKATNDGKVYGTGVSFEFYGQENEVEDHTLLRTQVDQLRRRILQLSEEMLEVQKLEFCITGRLDAYDYPLVPALPGPMAPSRLAIQDSTPSTKPIQNDPRQKPRGGVEVLPPKVEDRQPSRPQIVQPDLTGQREVRIFISSPFKDMNEERDLLMKRIIPKLRKLCMERDVLLTCVDLRWGVTESQSQQAATLLMVLREITRSNIFLGCLGERYGWCLSEHSYRKPTPQDELLNRTIDLAAKEFPWITKFKDRSVTEIEMRSLLTEAIGGPPKSAWFYLRDPYYSESVPSDKRNDFLSEGDFEKKKLYQLKDDVGKSRFETNQYTRPLDFSELVLADVTKYIDGEYPRGSELAPLQKERFLHTAFARSLTQVYLQNDSYFMELDKHVSSNTHTPLVVTGEDGIGRSALLANWALRYRTHHPEDILIEHYIGATSTSGIPVSLLRRVMDELQDQLHDRTDDIPADVKEMEKTFPHWIEKTLHRNKRNRLVVVIDGLNSLDKANNAHALLWLPRQFPSAVRVILSSSPGRTMSILETRDYQLLPVQRLKEAERASFIRKYLDLSSKKLTEAQEFKIAGASQAGNPRYLKTLCEDISVWGAFDKLDGRIGRYLRAGSTSELYEIVLERIEKDFGEKIVSSFMTLIWASHRGLNVDSELSVLLEEEGHDQNSWNSLFLGVEDLLFISGGLANFSNSEIRLAVENRYIKDEKSQKNINSKLAALFGRPTQNTSAVERQIDELPWQLLFAQNWQQLFDCITNLKMFCGLYTDARKFDFFRYWRALEDQMPGIDIADSYIRGLARGNLPSDIIVGSLYFTVGMFLEEMAKYDGANNVYSQARNYYSISSQFLDVAKADEAIARIALLQARSQDASATLEKALALYIREKGEDDLSVSRVLDSMGKVYTDVNLFDKAKASFDKSIRISQVKLGPSDPVVGKTLANMATLYERLGDPKEALSCGTRALKIFEDEFGPDDFQLCSVLVSIGRIHMSNKNFEDAKIVYKRALVISEGKMGRDHPNTADIVYELGCFYFMRPEQIIGKGTEVAEKLKNKNFWQQKKNDNSTLLANKDHSRTNKKAWSKDKAKEAFVRALKCYEAAHSFDHPTVARVLTRLGSLYIEQVQYTKAENALKRSLEIKIKSFGEVHTRVAQTYKHLLTLYELQEEWEKAYDAGEKVLMIIDKIHKQTNSDVISPTLLRLGDVAASAGNVERGKQFLQRAREVTIKFHGSDNPEVKHIDQLIADLAAPRATMNVPTSTGEVVDFEKMRQEWETEVAQEQPKAEEGGRDGLLEAIRNFKKNKPNLASQPVARVQKNETERKGWWKQNYKYDGPVDVGPSKPQPMKKPSPPGFPSQIPQTRTSAAPAVAPQIRGAPGGLTRGTPPPPPGSSRINSLPPTQVGGMVRGTPPPPPRK